MSFSVMAFNFTYDTHNLGLLGSSLRFTNNIGNDQGESLLRMIPNSANFFISSSIIFLSANECRKGLTDMGG